MNLEKFYNKIRTELSIASARAMRLGGFLWRILSLNLADDRIASLHVLSVVLENGGVCVVYASRIFSRIKIRGMRRYCFEKGKYPTPENIVSAVTLAASELHAAHPQVILVIPKSWTIVKTTEFPLSVVDNLSDVITYELDRLTPFAADRAYYDYQLIGKNENQVQLIVGAVNKDILEPYIEALQEKKITINRITVGASAIGTLIDYAHKDGNIAFLSMENCSYEGGLIRDHQWSASITGHLPAKDEPTQMRMIAEEINRLLAAAGPGKGKTEVVLDWRLSEKNALLLRNSVQAKVGFLDKMDLNLHFLNRGDLPEVPYRAVGGALEHLNPEVDRMNLLLQGKHLRAKPALSLTIILLVILAALGLFWIVSPLQIEEWKIQSLDREIASRRENVKKVEFVRKDLQNVEKELAAIREFKTSRPQVLNLLKEITRILPKNTWLTRIRITDSIIEIEGYAASATEIVPKLELSEHFKKVEFASATARDTRLAADRFIIKMEIEGLPGEKVKYEKKK